MPPTVADRFWSKVARGSSDSCWPWLGGRCGGSNEYGSFRIGHRGAQTTAHRFAYELTFGPIPEGLTIDHVKARGCTSTLCCNPAHLEAVTMRTNVLRGGNRSAVNARRTVCLRGHAFHPRLRSDGSRWCITCHNERRRKVAS